MRRRVQHRLTSAVAVGESEQHRPAAIGRERHSAEGEQELETQVRPSPGHAHGHRPRCHVRFFGERGELGAVGLVAQQELNVAWIEPLQRRHESIGLFTVENPLFRSCRRGHVDEAVDVALADRSAAGVRREQVASRHDGVRLLFVRRQLVIDAGQAYERVLREVLDQVSVAGTGGQRAPHHVGELRHRVRWLSHRKSHTPRSAARCAPLVLVATGWQAVERVHALEQTLDRVARQRRASVRGTSSERKSWSGTGHVKSPSRASSLRAVGVMNSGAVGRTATGPPPRENSGQRGTATGALRGGWRDRVVVIRREGAASRVGRVTALLRSVTPAGGVGRRDAERAHSDRVSRTRGRRPGARELSGDV